MERAEELYRKGTALLESDPQKALKYLTDSLNLAPKAPPAIYNRIVAFARLGRDTEALSDLELLEEIAPALGASLRLELKASAAPYTDIANRALEDGHLDMALTKYESALAYDREYANAWVGKGVVLKLFGRNDEALQCFNKAVELEPRNYFAWINRAEFNLTQRRLEESVADYSKAIDILPDDPDAYLGRSTALLDLHRQEEAASDRALAERLAPGADHK